MNKKATTDTFRSIRLFPRQPLGVRAGGFEEGEADELVTEKKGEDLPGEELSDERIVEAGNFMKDKIILVGFFSSPI